MLKRCAVTALVLAATGTAPAQTTGFYVRASANYQQNRDVPLTDNLPPGAGSWFGYGVPGNPFGFVIPGNPNEGDKHPHSSRWGGGLALGYRASLLLRYELSVDRTSGSTIQFAYPSLVAPSPAESVWFSVTSTQMMGNVYLDVAPLLPPDALGPVNPYVMVGAGVSRNTNGDYLCNSLNSCTANSYATAATHYDFAWQTGLGIVWKITPAVAMDFGYRYVDMGTIRGADVQAPFPAWGLNGRLTANRFSAGLVYTFGGK
ncbi:MAG: outer membrane protein [Burkholderiales bacterium]